MISTGTSRETSGNFEQKEKEEMVNKVEWFGVELCLFASLVECLCWIEIF